MVLDLKPELSLLDDGIKSRIIVAFVHLYPGHFHQVMDLLLDVFSMVLKFIFLQLDFSVLNLKVPKFIFVEHELQFEVMYYFLLLIYLIQQGMIHSDRKSFKILSKYKIVDFKI